MAGWEGNWGGREIGITNEFVSIFNFTCLTLSLYIPVLTNVLIFDSIISLLLEINLLITYVILLT